MSSSVPNPSPAQVRDILIKHGIQARATDTNLLIMTGEPSGNLACLCVNGAAALAGLPDVALSALAPAVSFQTPQGQQYFYRCTQTEATRKLTNQITLHGQGDEIATYPTVGYGRISGTLTALPTLSWQDHCKMVEAIVQERPVQPMPQLTDENCELIYRTMKATEDNVAQVFEERYKDELRYCDTWGKWLQWDECRWKPEFTLLAFDYSRRIARKVNVEGNLTPAKASFARGVEFFARASRTFATTTDQWDSDTWLLNTPAGTVDLRDASLRPHRKTDHITKSTHVSPLAGLTPVFNVFMQEITLGDESLATYLQMAIGACLSGARQDNFLLFWYGTGQNGKNTLGDLVEWMLGDYVTVLTTETLMAPRSGSPQHLTFIADLRGSRIALSSEVEEGSYFNEARIKSLTGDATIKANYMRRDPFAFPRTHKHIIYGNHRPMLRSVDPAIRSRLHIVPFKAYFPPDRRDPDMGAKLRAEAPAILQWLIEGHSMWLEKGRLTMCSAVQAETDSYFDAQSTPDMWIAECCVRDALAKGSAKDLYASFKNWKESRGEGAMSQTRWGEWMSSQFDRIHMSGRIFYRGVDLRPQSIFDQTIS